MADVKTNRKRSNRVFKSLHKPLTYLGVERTAFLPHLCQCGRCLQYLQHHPGRGRGVHRRIRIRALGDEKRPGLPSHSREGREFKPRYDAAKQKFPWWRSADADRLDRVIKPWKEPAALNAQINLYGFWERRRLPNQERRSRRRSPHPRRRLRESGSAANRNMQSSGWNPPSKPSGLASTSTSTFSKRIVPTFLLRSTTTR